MIAEERRSSPMQSEHLAMVLGSFERRLDAIAERADQAWNIGSEAVQMHRETRALLEPHIARDDQFLETLKEMKALLERRRVAITFGKWAIRLGIVAVATVFWLHDSISKLASIFRDHIAR